MVALPCCVVVVVVESWRGAENNSAFESRIRTGLQNES